MIIETTEVLKCKCDRCGHEWRSSTGEKPLQCPRCKTYKWNDGKPAPARAGILGRQGPLL